MIIHAIVKTKSPNRKQEPSRRSSDPHRSCGMMANGPAHARPAQRRLRLASPECCPLEMRASVSPSVSTRSTSKFCMQLSNLNIGN